MLTLKDFLIWRAVWIPIILNIEMQENHLEQEVSNMAHIEPINQVVVVILTVVRPSFVQTVAASVWAGILLDAVKERYIWQKESRYLINE